MPVSKRTRYEVLKRDNFTCRYCRSTEAHLKVDHVVPVALGGSDNPDNLVAACQDCNAGKASTSPTEGMVADVKEEDVRWAGAIKRVTAARSRQIKKRDGYVRAFDECWSAWSYGGEEKLPIPRPMSWKASLERYYELGVPLDEILRLARTALSREKVSTDETFRYFAGCVWRYVDEVQQEARNLLATDRPGGAN